MKKILVVLLSLLMLLGLSACGDKGTSDELQTVSNNGVSIQLPANAEDQDPEGEAGYAIFYGNKEFAMTVSPQYKDALIENGFMQEGEGLDEFATVLTELTGKTFEKNSDGNYTAKYSNTINNGDFSYYSTVRDGKDCFWILDFFCFTKDAETFYPKFEAWEKTFKAD